jgi:hypothetical protein|tara:strand:+ start:281 stop:436 length:156 start_codon:yes stop_codon:yes gene_type:complete
MAYVVFFAPLGKKKKRSIKSSFFSKLFEQRTKKLIEKESKIIERGEAKNQR